MIPARILRKAVCQWQNWRSRRTLHRAFPELMDMDRAERACRKGHKRGSAAIIKRKRAFMCEQLCREVDADLARVFPARSDRDRLREIY